MKSIPPEAAARRRYKRLAPAEEIELRAAWEAGVLTLDDLAIRFSMSRRGIQRALQRLGATKGAAVTAAVLTANSKALETMPPLPEDHAERVQAARDMAFCDAWTLQRLAMMQAQEVAQIGGAAGVRLTSKLAETIARTRAVMWASLGIDKLPPVEGELPELRIHEMTEVEVTAIRNQQQIEDARLGLRLNRAEPDPADDVEIIEEEGLNQPQHAEPPERVGGDDGPL